MFISNLSDVISELKTKLPDYVSLHIKDSSKHFKCLNPNHKDTQASACIDPKSGKTRGHCFGCAASFDVFTLANWLEGLPVEGPGFIQETVVTLANRFNIHIDLGEVSEHEKRLVSIRRAYCIAGQYVANPDTGKWTEDTEKYITQHNWHKQDLAELGIGVGSREELTQHMINMGYTAEFLREINLLQDSAQVIEENRIIFTIYDGDNRVVGFSARCFNDIKYINTPTNELFTKGNILYGLNWARRSPERPIYIFEGYGDVVSARLNGLTNCVALMGSHLSDGQMKFLRDNRMKRIILCLDYDEAGCNGTKKAVDEVLVNYKDFNVSIACKPQNDCKDPGELIERFGIKSLLSLGAIPVFDWTLNRFSGLTGTELATKLVPVVASEPNAIVRESFVRSLSEKTGVSTYSIDLEVNKIVNQQVAALEEQEESLVNIATREIRLNPSDRIGILTKLTSDLYALKEKTNSGKLGSRSLIHILDEQLSTTKSSISGSIGFDMPLLRELRDCLDNGKDWSRSTLMILGGSENSGKCLAEDTEILLGDGTYKKLKDMVDNEPSDIISMNNSFKLECKNVKQWIDSGKLPCYRITLSSGLQLEASETHPFFTTSGWKKLSELSPEDQIATAAQYKCFDRLHSPIKECEAIFLAGILAEGGLTSTGIVFTNSDKEVIDLFKKSVLAISNNIDFTQSSKYGIAVVGKKIPPKNKRSLISREPNKIRNFLKGYDLIGRNSYTKKIPDDVFRCSKKIIAKFLGMFYACDGWASKKDDKSFEIGISLCNKEMILQIRRLLLRFNIHPTMHESTSSYKGSNKRFPRYTLSIVDQESLRKFYNSIRIPHIEKQQRLKDYLSGDYQALGSYNDYFPCELWKYIISVMNEKKLSLNDLSRLITPTNLKVTYKPDQDRFALISNYNQNIKYTISPSNLRSIGYILNDKFLISLAEGDINFTVIKSIEPIGVKQCYDLTVEETHNFIANDIVVHNSSLMSFIAANIAFSDKDDPTVIYLSIDDSAPDISPKLVASVNCLLKNKIPTSPEEELNIGQIINPLVWAENHKFSKGQLNSLIKRRIEAFEVTKGLASSERLILKDASDGTTLDYAEAIVRYYRSRYPSKKIVIILDNTHNLSDYSNIQDRRDRFIRIADRMNRICNVYSICMLASVEYRKHQGVLSSNKKPIPNNDEISETASFKYRAKWIGHIYNDMHIFPESYDIFHEHPVTKEHLPRILLVHAKTKINGYKGTNVFDFYPGMSAFLWKDEKEAKSEAREFIEIRKAEEVQEEQNEDW